MKSIRARLLALIIGLISVVPLSFADDIDIYNNYSTNSIQPPYTIIVLDLNLLGICNSVLTQTSNPNNPSAPQLCLNITSSMVLSDVLAGITSNPTAYLTTLLTGNYSCPTGTPAATCGSNAQALCSLYGILGISSPLVQLPGLGPILQPLLGGVSTLSCGTLNFLLGIPLISGIINPLLSGFVGQLVTGLVSPLLTTTVGQLPTAIIGLLQTTISGVLNLGQTDLLSLLGNILGNLINTNVAIMVSHADRSNLTGSPASACSFGESAAIAVPRRNTGNCSNGAYMLVGFTRLADQTTVTSLLTRVTTLLTNTLSPTNLLSSTTALLGTALTTPAQLLPPYQGKEVYAEIAHYLAGNDVFNAPLSRWDGLTGLLTRDTSIELANGNYVKPALECRTANVLNIMLTNNIRDTESDATLRSYFPGLPGGSITLSNVVSQALNPGFKDNTNRDINLNSYFLVQNLLTDTNALANAGGTVLTYVDRLGLLGLGQSTAQLLKPTLSINASMLTPSLTYDLRNPGVLRSEAFFSLFKPGADQNARWIGNLKRLQLRANAGNATGGYDYYDRNNTLAVEGSDGRIKTTALTYWTSSSLLGGLSADGRESRLGGVGQKIPGYQVGGGGNPGRANTSGTRHLYYDKYNSGQPTMTALNVNASNDMAVTDLVPDLALTAETAANCGTAKTTAQMAQEILLYTRGFNTGSSCRGSLGSSGVVGRDWMHGAVLHSRPVAINYGARGSYTAANPDIRIVYGSNDGLLRMARNTDTSGGDSGEESWAFLPRAVINEQKTLRDGTGATRFPYGVDGAPTVLLQDRNPSGGAADGKIESSNTQDKAYVYFGLRRGGSDRDKSSYYALNVTDPEIPAMMWRIGRDGLYNSSGFVAGSAAQFGELALTFSSPQVTRLAYKVNASDTTAVTKSVVIFTGGYNGGRDSSNARVGKDAARGSVSVVGSDDYSCVSSTCTERGNALYIVDAETGALIWKAKRGSYSSSSPYDSSSRSFQHPLLVNSFGGDITVVDTGGDGLADRLYVADTGGRLWRADFPGTDRNAWKFTPVASLGRHESSATNNVENDRRFFGSPDFVPFRDTSGSYDAVIIASGDREDPTNYSTQNYLYVYRDREASVTVRTNESDLLHNTAFTDVTTTCATSSSSTCAVPATSSGWRLRLSSSGEKAFSQPLTSNKTVYFSTYVPPAQNVTSCQPQEGSSKLYGVSLYDSRPAVAAFNSDTDSDARSTVSATPGLGGDVSPVNTDAIANNGQTVKTSGLDKQRVYWRERRGDEEIKQP